MAIAFLSLQLYEDSPKPKSNASDGSAGNKQAVELGRFIEVWNRENSGLDKMALDIK